MIQQLTRPLVAGEHLSRDEFLRRWEAMPHLKHAELIGGKVYMTSPVSRLHAQADSQSNMWISHYAAYTPVCETGGNATWFMLNDVPQPDVYLRLLEEYGGKSRLEKSYLAGAPELVVETCLSSASHDLNEKFQLYQKAGVDEYIAILAEKQTVYWHRLVNGKYRKMRQTADGVMKSVVFPGLWLDVNAFFERDSRLVLKVLEEGLNTIEHGEFVQNLVKRKPGH